MRVHVFGDVIIDRYTYSDPLKLSAETPTIVGSFKSRETFVGGAGLVVRHLLNLGAQVNFTTILGGHELLNLQQALMRTNDPITPEESSRLEISSNAMVEGWKMSRKDRFFVGPYKIFQLDELNQARHNMESEHKLLLQESGSLPDAVVVCDNRHGVISQTVLDILISRCNEQKVPIYVDSQSAFHGGLHVHGATRLFLNADESQIVCAGTSIYDTVRRLDSGLVVKCGEHGAHDIDREAKIEHFVPGVKVDVVDTCGAGDAFLAAYVVLNDLSKANEYAAHSVTLKGTRVHG